MTKTISCASTNKKIKLVLFEEPKKKKKSQKTKIHTEYKQKKNQIGFWAPLKNKNVQPTQ